MVNYPPPKGNGFSGWLFIKNKRWKENGKEKREKMTMKKLNNENTYAILEAGKTYKFAGYSWTTCEVDKEHHTAVIQSHGVTSGAWPGYVMPQFGNGNFDEKSIDGQNIRCNKSRTCSKLKE